MTNPKDLGTALEVRRGNIDRQNAAEPQYFHVRGVLTVTQLNAGTCEGLADVNFPVYFIDQPRFSYGSHLDLGQPFEAGVFPTCSLTVLRWGERMRDDGTPTYAGASFGVVTSGPLGQVMVVQWHMEGLGLRGPTTTAAT